MMSKVVYARSTFDCGPFDSSVAYEFHVHEQYAHALINGRRIIEDYPFTDESHYLWDFENNGNLDELEVTYGRFIECEVGGFEDENG